MRAMSLAYLFPGQGSQYIGMGLDLYEHSVKVRELFALAADISETNLREIIFNGTEDELKDTKNSQIAISLVNMAVSTCLGELGFEPSACAGFSLGEFSALWQAGVLSTTDILTIVHKRGLLMDAAIQTLDHSAGVPGMAAVLGLAYEEIVELLAKIKEGKVYAANYNSSSQVVIAGDALGLKSAQVALQAAGAMKIIPLKVSGPFHTPLLQEAADLLREFITKIEFRDPKIMLYSNVTGEKIRSGAEAKKLSVLQITKPVLWVREEESIFAALSPYPPEKRRFLELGPGKVLSGLWKSFNRKEKCIPLGNMDQIKELAGGN